MEEQEVSPDYLKRVNDGYLLAKHMPELAEQLKEAVKDREDGFKAGIEQFAKEQEKEYYPSWLSKDRLSSLDKEPDQEKHKDGPDLDKE